MKLLLFSNSTNAGEKYLAYTKPFIHEFLKDKEPNDGIFVPYAGVSISYDDYFDKVNQVFTELGFFIKSIHQSDKPEKAIEKAGFIIVGGGNTFHLLKELQDKNLIEIMKNKVVDDIPYIGWSAGSNIICPTIKTTNDMPIVEVKNLKALSVLPFQINPHYVEKNPDGHAGETRQDRIEEFLIANPDVYVVGLREGTLLKYENNRLRLKGKKPAKIFRYGMEPLELENNDNFEFLMKR